VKLGVLNLQVEASPEISY